MDDSHLRSVNWWRRQDLPTPISPIMMYLKMYSYGNDMVRNSLLRKKEEKKRTKKEEVGKAITHAKRRKKKRGEKEESRLTIFLACIFGKKTDGLTALHCNGVQETGV